jgi:chitinase
MKSIRLLLKLICIGVVLAGCNKKSVKALQSDQTTKQFKVVGYLFASGDILAKSQGVDFSRITHLIVAFINPDAAGNFAPVTGLEALAKKAHDNKVKIIAAFAGGNPPQHLKELLKPENRKKLVEGLTELTRTYNLDGIDVDLEGDFVNENYEAFVVDLSASLKKNGRIMTAAVATWNSAAYSDKAIRLFDLINIMSYDQTGPWRKDQPGPHSTYEAAEADFEHWNKRGIVAEKLILGLPFYAYGFGPDISEDMNFGNLVAAYPGSENVDQWNLPGKGTFYYNGIPTIKKKVGYAIKKKAGGVMIWQLLGDATGDLSLLKAINDEVAKQIKN